MENESENIARIELTRGCFAIVDAEDFPYLSRYKWFVYGKYAAGRMGGSKNIAMHRFIMAAVNGVYVDHINGDRFDNRKANLRICTNRQNSWNCPKKEGSSQYRGVSWSKGMKKWEASITNNGKRVVLGYFESEKEAAQIRDRDAIDKRGEFAQLNFPLLSSPNRIGTTQTPSKRRPKKTIFNNDGTVSIECTRGCYAVIDIADYEVVKNCNWSVSHDGNAPRYAITPVRINGKFKGIPMHRILMNPPDNFVVDHIDGNGFNNRRSNLRICTIQENARNVKARRNNTSGYKGVTLHKRTGVWMAGITINKKSTYIGQSKDKETAARMYDAAAKEHFGEFANLNFPV